MAVVVVVGDDFRAEVLEGFVGLGALKDGSIAFDDGAWDKWEGKGGFEELCC